MDLAQRQTAGLHHVQDELWKRGLSMEGNKEVTMERLKKALREKVPNMSGADIAWLDTHQGWEAIRERVKKQVDELEDFDQLEPRARKWKETSRKYWRLMNESSPCTEVDLTWWVC